MSRTPYGTATETLVEALMSLKLATAKQLSNATGIPSSTVRTMMVRLGDKGLVSRHPSGGYYLSQHPDTGDRYELLLQLVKAA